MPERFWSSEEYDEQAHTLYNEGNYDGALSTLKEGLTLYPNSVELYVGLGYARLAREEFAWARMGFEQALILDPAHEDALVGMGEVLLRLGYPGQAMELFSKVEALGYGDDVELMLTMGRALYREGLYPQARDLLNRLLSVRADASEALATVGYATHRMGDEIGACRLIRRALRMTPDLHEGRIYLAHILYDRGDSEGALREFERVPPPEHWDPLALWRLIELKRIVLRWPEDDPRLAPWSGRLAELDQQEDDPIERLLAEVEAQAAASDEWGFQDQNQLELFHAGEHPLGVDPVVHVRFSGGRTFHGTPHEVVRQYRDDCGFSHETIQQFMRRMAERWQEEFGMHVPSRDPEYFLRSLAEHGLIRVLREDEDT